MMDMVERVSKAIFEAMDVPDGPDASAAERYARAAIEAMREPTKEMLSAGEDGINSLPALPGHYAEYCWPAMIDAALSPNQNGG